MADDQDTLAPGTRDSALRPAESDLHPADPSDDLTGNTPGSEEGTTDDGPPVPDDAGWPSEDPADADALRAELPDADLPLPGDAVPGDGTVDQGRSPEEADTLHTAEYGRESGEAAAVTSDSAPRPRETPVE
jgi:hypothetical protein